MGVSRVDFDGETLIDLTDDTVTPQSLLSGYSAHNKAGELIEGLAVIPTKVSELKNDSKFITETGDSSKTTVTFEQAVKRANVNSGDDLSTAFGKLSKFCEDLKPHAFSAPITNLFATVTGNSLDATMGKNLKDLHDANKNEINAINSKLINIKTLNFKGASGAVYINAMFPTIILFAPCTSPGFYTQLFLNIYNMWYVYLYKADGSLVTDPIDVTIVVGSI